MKEIPLDTDLLTVSLLLFGAGGLDYGVPVSQIRSSGKLDFHPERILPGLPWTALQGEEALFLLTAGEREYLVPIESMEEVLEITLTEIRPFPEWLEPFALSRGMWGLLARHGHFYILLDFGSVPGKNTHMDKKTDDPKDVHTQESP